MKRLWAILLVGALALACSNGEGQNVANGNHDDVLAGDTGDDVDEVEDIQVADPQPAFGDKLAWKLALTGEDTLWNGLHGVVNGDGSYNLFAVGGFGAVAWLDSDTGAWNHLNLAQTLELNSVWADGTDYIVVCGEQGLLKRYFDFAGNGTADWYNDDLSTGLTTELESVHAFDRDHIWAVGEDGGILQFDGETWTNWSPAEVGLPEDPAPTLYAVAVVGPDKAYIAGDGYLVTWEAGAFTVNDTDFADRKLRALHVGGDTVWLGADKGSIFELQGDGTWLAHQPNVYSTFTVLWYSPDGTLFAAAGAQPDPTLWSWDGNADDSWEYLAVESPKFIQDSYPQYAFDKASRITGIWGTGNQNLYVSTKEKQIAHYAIHP